MSIWTRIKEWLIKGILDMEMPIQTIVAHLNNIDVNKDGNISVREIVELFKSYVTGRRT